jgi:hypothetical protein
VISLIANGAFERYPSLRVCVAGCGLTWISGVLRRADVAWRAFRVEVPWMSRPPREYFQDHVRVSTYGLESQGAAAPMLREFVARHLELRELVVYGSGYPTWDSARAPEVADFFPADWRTSVFADNARSFFRWEARDPAAEGPRAD